MADSKIYHITADIDRVETSVTVAGRRISVRAALLHTTTHVAVGNLTAASTLALAFFAAIFADFKAVAELGWIAGCGVLLCAFACFTVMPALLRLFDRRRRAGGGNPLLLRLPNQGVYTPARLSSRVVQ